MPTMQIPYDIRDKGLPSLKSLIAFEATVRLGSMTAASRELDTTQPAISQRIRLLEDSIGSVLFDRSSGRLTPTQTGWKLYEDVSSALKAIEQAVRRYKAEALSQQRKVTIAAHFGFAHVWLLPRLPEIEHQFPELQFEIVPVDRDDSPEMTQADFSIRFGHINANDKNERLLIHELVFPICSPAFAKRHSIDGFITADHLSQVPLLHLDKADRRWLDWEQWSRCANLSLPAQSPRIRYNNYPLLLNAAKEGHGLALGWSLLVEQAISEGQLIAMSPSVERQDFGYILRSRFLDNAVIIPIIKWFASQMKRSHDRHE